MPALIGDPPAATEPITMPDRRDLALVAVERTRMAMAITDPTQPDNPIVLANQAFYDLTGYSATEVLGQNCRFLQGPDTATEAVDEVRRGLHDHAAHITVELLNYRKDGSTFWNQLVISPVFDDHGQLIYYFSSQKDVTARREAEERERREHLLLMEVDHRAMNALAVVQSIVRLTRADNIADFSASILGRIDSIARAHRLLAASAWEGTRLEQLIEGEAPSRAVGRISLSGPRLALPGSVVQPLALVVHELMTNAVRHGALLDPDGKVDVRWTYEGEQFMIRWREQQGRHRSGLPALGFGLRMITNVIERQLAGKANISWKEGLDAEFSLPLRMTE